MMGCDSLALARFSRHLHSFCRFHSTDDVNSLHNHYAIFVSISVCVHILGHNRSDAKRATHVHQASHALMTPTPTFDQ